MTKTDWTITWPAPLMPEAAMIPEGDVFLKSSQQYSLVALHDHTPGLLFSTPDVLPTVAQQVVDHQSIEYSEETVQETGTVAESIETDPQQADQDFGTSDPQISQDFGTSDPQINQDFVAFLDMEAGSFI